MRRQRQTDRERYRETDIKTESRDRAADTKTVTYTGTRDMERCGRAGLG